MPTPKKAKQPDMCPNCYLFEQKDEPLIFRPGSDLMHRCGRGHRYEDVDALQNLPKQMIHKKEAIETAKNPPPEPDPAAPIKQALTGTGILIEKDDRVRIESIVGHFTDSSSLFGSVYAINEELKDTKEALAAMKAAQLAAKRAPGSPVGSTEARANGDLAITAVVPERFVQPLMDIAAANGMDVVTYYNSVIDNAFESQWFF